MVEHRLTNQTIRQETRTYFQPRHFLLGLVSKHVDASFPSVGGVCVNSIDMSQVAGEDAGTVQQLFDAFIRAAIGGHKAAEFLCYEGFWREVR